MAIKTNILFLIFVLSLFLFADSLKNKGLKKTTEEIEADKELKFGMVQDFDKESLVELQLEDMYTTMMDENSNFMEMPKEKAANKLSKAKKVEKVSSEDY